MSLDQAQLGKLCLIPTVSPLNRVELMFSHRVASPRTAFHAWRRGIVRLPRAHVFNVSLESAAHQQHSHILDTSLSRRTTSRCGQLATWRPHSRKRRRKSTLVLCCEPHFADREIFECSLFNDPILSDIKILQVFNGETKEYYAHKQILINQSEYFLKAFTGNFKEATENTMTLEDDDPIYFEMMLKFICTTSLHVPKTSTLTNDDPRKTVDLLLGIYKVADKYAVTDMLLVISNKLSDALQGFSWLCGVPRYQKFEEIIEAYYQDCPSSNTLPGLAIAHATLKYAF